MSYCNLKEYKWSHTHIIKVDDHGAVAHVRGLVVGLTAGGEGHPAGAGADRHAQGVTGGLGWRSGVTYDQAFPLKDDGLCVILAPRLHWAPQQEQGQQYGEVEGDWPGTHDWTWGCLVEYLGLILPCRSVTLDNLKWKQTYYSERNCPCENFQDFNLSVVLAGTS